MNNSRKDRIDGYLYALDGLRAMSLIFIVMFHTFQQSWIFYNLRLTQTHYLFNFEIFQRYGYVAIDSFFVLSGFCLFYPIARDMLGERKFGGWKNFFIKRARRIYPSYILMLVLLVIFPTLSYHASYDPKNAAQVAKHFLYHLFFIHNFNAGTIGSTISTAWTMSVEVHFYLMFPLLCVPFRKKPVLTAVGMVLTGVIVRLVLLCNTNISPPIISAITPTYFDVFGLGMLAAYFVVYFRNKCKDTDRFKPFMTAISALCIFCAVCYIYWLSRSNFPDGYSRDVYFRFLYRGLFSALLSAFLFTACFSYSFWEKSIWGNRFFVFLSTISYTVYLWHQNIYIFLKTVHIPYTVTDPVTSDRAAMEGLTFICLAASLIIGVAVTKYVEGPIVKYGVRGCCEKISSFFGGKKSAPTNGKTTTRKGK